MVGDVIDLITEPKLAKTSPNINTEGARRLAAAVIESAVTDYKALQKRGVIVGGKLNPDWLVENKTARYKKGNPTLVLKKPIMHYRTPAEILDLIGFFADGGSCEYWLSVSKMDISFERIRDFIFSDRQIKLAA
jgi:hypothetical protein